MKLRIKILAVALVGITMVGCATAPKPHDVDNSRTYPTSYDQTWENIVSFFASRNIQIKNIAKDSGVIYAEKASFDDSLADCGKSGMFTPVAHRALLNVFVKKVPAGTSVSVNTDFSETRRFGDNVTTVQCTSYGTLERAILESAGA